MGFFPLFFFDLLYVMYWLVNVGMEDDSLTVILVLQPLNLATITFANYKVSKT